MSDDFMNFLEARRASYLKGLEEIEDYQMKYASTILELYQQVSRWMEPYEKEGYLIIEEKPVPQPHNDRLSELILNFEGRDKVYLRPDYNKLSLDKPFTITIDHSENKRLETTLNFSPNEGWYITNKNGIGFGKKLITDHVFKTIVMEKLEKL